MSHLPAIKQKFIDIVTINEFKLAVYPSYLVFGIPVYQDFSLVFESNNYIRIKEHQITVWIDFFDRLAQILGNPDNQEELGKETLIVTDTVLADTNVNTLDVTKLDNCCYFVIKVELNQKIVYLTAKYQQTIYFTLPETESFLFIQAFRSIFFKIYAYPERVNFYTLEIVKKCPIKYLEDDSNEKIFDFIQTIYFLQENELYYITELVRRHRLLFIKFKQLQQL